MAEEYIRDKRNQILGRIHTEGNGRRVAKANNGTVLGYYDPSKGNTYDARGNRLSPQDITVSLVWQNQSV